MSTTTPPTFAEIAAEAADLAAKNGPFVDPSRCAVVKDAIRSRPTWADQVLGRHIEHGQFGPLIFGAELELLYVAFFRRYEPDTPDPDVPVTP